MTTRKPLAKSVPVGPARGDLCLRFANTRYWRGSDQVVEKLGAIGDLIDWSARAENFPPQAIDGLRRWSDHHRAAAATLFAEAIDIREAIYRSFAAIASGRPIAGADLATLNRALADAPRRGHLVRVDDRYGWEIERMTPAAPALLAPVLWSAADLLTHANHAHVRQCANEQCLWLFVDHSKAGTRRWCDMSSCGNRAKSRRHYLKNKQQPAH